MSSTKLSNTENADMAKRFTATEKWEDSWFRKLKPAQKLLWVYMLDRCDMTGVLDLDVELAEFCIGTKVNMEGFGTRVVKLNGSKVWIPKFIQFQYGVTADNLDPSKPVHRGVLKSLEKHGLLDGGVLRSFDDDTLSVGYQRAIDSPKDKNKDMDKEKEKAKAKEERPKSLDDVMVLFSERRYNPKEAEKFWNYYESNGWKVGKNPMKDWKAAAANWAKNSREWNGGKPTERDPAPRMKRCEKCGKDYPSKLILCPRCYPQEQTTPPAGVMDVIEGLANKMSAK
jgi:hypothetical protein